MKVILIILFLILSNLNYFATDSSQEQKFSISLTPFLLKSLNFISYPQEEINQEKFIVYISNLEKGCEFKATTITAKYLGSTKHFDIYLNSDYSTKNYDIIAKSAEEVYERIVEYFNKTPYNKEERLLLLFTPLNEKTQRLMVSGYTMPGYDVNNKSIIYIDINFIYLTNEIAFKEIIAHELTHYVQAAFSHLEEDNDLWIIEGTANFMTDYAIIGYNPISSELNFLKDYTNITFGKRMYCLDIEGYLSNYLLSYLFFVYLSEKYGIDIVKKIWENYKYFKGFTLIEKITGEKFTDLYKEFVFKNYLGNYKGTPFLFENTYFKFKANKVVKSEINDWKINPLAFDYFTFDSISKLISLSNFNDNIQAILYDEILNKTYEFPKNTTSFQLFENSKHTLIILNTGNLTERITITNYNVKEIKKYEIKKGLNKINIEKLNITLEINSTNDTYLYLIIISNLSFIKEISKTTLIFILYYNKTEINLPILVKINLDDKIYSLKYLDFNDFKIKEIKYKIIDNIIEYEIYNQYVYFLNINYFIKIGNIDIEKLPFYFTLISLLIILLFLQIYTIKRTKKKNFDLTQ